MLLKGKIAGAIFPIPAKLTERFFTGSHKVFVKCLPRKSTRLQPKRKIIFYASHASKELIGEATIEKLEFLTPEDVIVKYKSNLFLEEDEFRCYARGRKKEFLVLNLINLKKYTKPIKFKNVTMAGQYITQAEYHSLIQHQRERS